MVLTYSNASNSFLPLTRKTWPMTPIESDQVKKMKII